MNREIEPLKRQGRNLHHKRNLVTKSSEAWQRAPNSTYNRRNKPDATTVLLMAEHHSLRHEQNQAMLGDSRAETLRSYCEAQRTT